MIYRTIPNEAEELADLLADNRIAEMAEMDEKMLREVFNSISVSEIDVSISGFTAEEVEKITKALTVDDVSPDDFGDTFTLNDADIPMQRTITVLLNEEQFNDVTNAFSFVKKDENFTKTEGANESGNCLHRVVLEWAEQKKLLLR